MVYILAFLAAFFTSLASSFAGGGASLMLFPLLLMLLPGSAYASILTTTKASAATMSVTSGFMHSKLQKLNWKLFWVITGFQILGTAFGTYLVQYHLNEELFEFLLGGTLVVAAVYLLFKKQLGVGGREERELSFGNLLFAAVFFFGINVLNGLFGGTGIFCTLFLVVFWRMSFIRAVAYGMASYAIVNVLQAGYLLATEYADLFIVLSLVAGSMLGGVAGTKLQYLKGNSAVRYAMITLMLALAVKVLLL